MTIPLLIAQALTTTDDAADDIRPLRGAVEIPEPAPIWPYFAAAAALVAIGLLAYFLLRKKQAEAVRRSASEVALAELESARGGIAKGDSRAFAYEVSDVLRRYLDHRFGLRAPRQTTEEFLAAVAANPASPLGAQRRTLADFLAHCDLGKFGRWSLDTPQMEALHASAVRVVTETSAPA